MAFRIKSTIVKEIVFCFKTLKSLFWKFQLLLKLFVFLSIRIPFSDPNNSIFYFDLSSKAMNLFCIKSSRLKGILYFQETFITLVSFSSASSSTIFFIPGTFVCCTLDVTFICKSNLLKRIKYETRFQILERSWTKPSSLEDWTTRKKG